jgi:hypothetical protein
MLISGLRKNFPSLKLEERFSVFIDEFDAFGTEAFATFMNKGRDSRFMIHVAHQTLSDLGAVSKEFAEKVMGNCNVRLVFRLDVPDDAETMARTIGTQEVIKETYQTNDGSRTGVSSNRAVREFLVSPDDIKSLPDGTCIFSMKMGAIHRKVRIPFSQGQADAWKPKGGEMKTPGGGPVTRGFYDPQAVADHQASKPLRPERYGVPQPKPKPKRSGDGKGHWGRVSSKNSEIKNET